MHARQLFLLLLLNRPQQSLHIRIALRLLLTALLRQRLWLLLRLRTALLLRIASAPLLLLHGLFAPEGDLELALRGDV